MNIHTNIPTSDMESDDHRVRRIGLWMILIVFGGFGLWAAIAPLSSAAVAPGVVTVDGYRKAVQHLEGGLIKAMFVRDGDLVTKGQTLLTLDDTQSRAQLEVLRGQLFIFLAREARLRAQRDGQGHVEYPAALMQHASDLRVQDAIRVQDQTFTVRQRAQDGEVSLYRQQIGQLQAKIGGLAAQKRGLDQLVDSFRGEFSDFQSLLKEGYAEKQKVQEIGRSLAQNQGQRGEVLSEIAATNLAISETQLKILQLKKDLQREVAKELSEVQLTLFDLQEKLQSLQNTFGRTTVKAPQAGMVLGLTVHTVGAVVPPGGKLLETCLSMSG